MRPENSTDVPGLADGTSLAVLSGHPTPREVAAVVVALDAVRRHERRSRGGANALPAWQRAGIAEGVGGRPVSTPADLRDRRGPTR